ncbi:MAG: leucyl aminopeptidase [Nitrospiraceae bacterium]|nr:leucyl aminopeptidase [Nitrospiraceae bacterium]
MDVFIKNAREVSCACDALILPMAETDPSAYSSLGPSVSKLIKKVFSMEFSGRKNEVLLLPASDDLKPGRLLLVGLGKKAEITAETLRQAGGRAASHLQGAGMKTAALSTRVISGLKLSPADFIEGALLGSYAYKRYKKENNYKELKTVTILARPSQALAKAVGRAKTVAASVSFARDLVNTPANDMTPSHLARAAAKLRGGKMTVRVLGRKDAERLGMGAFLSVARGSHEPPKFIILEYKGGKGAPVALIGKSITFDSGGISLKPAEGMEKMKYDMAGGAAVLGVMKAVKESRMPLHVIGILPATENLPGGSATKPGDVVRSISGTTVEVISTDAEGRMVIADAMGYARRYKPRALVDIATLTGACSIALGNEAIAMMGNDRGLIERFRDASERTCERVWEMPLFEEYKEYLKSDVADLKNAAGRTGSLVTSAWFLKEFAGDAPWVHLDIAGTAWTEKDKPYMPKGSTGIGVRLILSVLEELK